MIRHIVMWKFREGTEEKANEFLTKLAALDLSLIHISEPTRRS